MISEICAKNYCREDISLIENYEKAMKDTKQIWVCHHILGEILSTEQLKAHEFYYNVPACMLKFVTSSEHRRIHNKGKHHSEETRKKTSDAMKGKTSPRKGVILSEETKKKISAAHKGRKTKGSTGMHWYNNGVINKYEYSCPDGFVKGRLK